MKATVKPDPAKLLGYRLNGAASPTKLGAKTGQKLGAKEPPVITRPG